MGKFIKRPDLQTAFENIVRVWQKQNMRCETDINELIGRMRSLVERAEWKTVNRWIPCIEQMPDRFDTVLLAILSKNGYGKPAYYVTIGGLKNGKEFESYTGEMAEGEKVTHWMPLPNEPEVKHDE